MPSNKELIKELKKFVKSYSNIHHLQMTKGEISESANDLYESIECDIETVVHNATTDFVC